jgi:hypothetical protein
VGANARIMQSTVASGLLCLFCAPAALAQWSEPPAWSELQVKNPQGIELSLRLTEPHSYRAGELIRAEIGFPGRSFALAQQPPQERWQFAGLLLDPAGNCGSPASPCFQSTTLGFDKTDPTLRLGDTSDPLAVSLNNYLPALRSARYRAAVLARKLVLTSRGPLGAYYGYADPPQYVISNTVEIEVIDATEAWVNQAIASSAAKLNGPRQDTPDAYEQRRVAAEQLRFLDEPAAWSASLALLPSEENILLRGFAATREPARVCELMQAAVPAPSQAVSTYYLNAMSGACARATLPPAPPYVPPPGEKPPEPSAEQQQYSRQRQEFVQGVIGKANARLAASLARKQGGAKAIAFQTLMEHVRQIRANEPRQPFPAWIPAVKEEFAKSFAEIEGGRQRHLLGLYASTLRSPDMVPLLESVLDAWKPGDYYEASREALQALYAIDPARAQARIVAELARGRTWLDAPQLEMLPASVARITDDALIEALATAQRVGGGNVQLRMTALAKYASPTALPRITAIYESQQDSCQPELIAYFVRRDPAYADRVFHSHPWDMHVAPPRCTLQYFKRTPQVAMAPVLERYMAVYLMHGDVLLKRTAAQSLGRFGSPVATGPLWDAFRYFHDYWKGKQAELTENREGVDLEVELRNAIARARNWLATETDLRTIESLCVSERCLYETQRDLRAWQRPLGIEVSSQPGGIRAQVAQYYGIESIETLEEKLGQFPKGTQLVLTVNGDGADRAAIRIRQFAAAHGLTVVSH